MALASEYCQSRYVSASYKRTNVAVARHRQPPPHPTHHMFSAVQRGLPAEAANDWPSVLNSSLKTSCRVLSGGETTLQVA